MDRELSFDELQAAVEKTRQLGARDVREGRLDPEALHLIPRELARESRPIWPAKYRQS